MMRPPETRSQLLARLSTKAREDGSLEVICLHFAVVFPRIWGNPEVFHATLRS
jgi:hypothetical protein